MARYVDIYDLESRFIKEFGEPRLVLNGNPYWDSKRITEIMNSAPTADVRENVRGEWQENYEVSTGGGSYRVFTCSNCGTSEIKRSPYCPWCGADVRIDINE